MKVTLRTVELLNRVKEIFRENPLRLEMGVWEKGLNEKQSSTLFPSCNTVGCIAGWLTIIDTNPELKPNESWNLVVDKPVENVVMGLFGVSRNNLDELNELFRPNHWKEPFRQQYYDLLLRLKKVVRPDDWKNIDELKPSFDVIGLDESELFDDEFSEEELSNIMKIRMEQVELVCRVIDDFLENHPIESLDLNPTPA